MELTKEYFDEYLKKLATKNDLKNFVTKDDLSDQTTRLVAYIQEAFEHQQIYIDERFKEQLAATELEPRVSRLERKVFNIK